MNDEKINPKSVTLGKDIEGSYINNMNGSSNITLNYNRQRNITDLSEKDLTRLKSQAKSWYSHNKPFRTGPTSRLSEAYNKISDFDPIEQIKKSHKDYLKRNYEWNFITGKYDKIDNPKQKSKSVSRSNYKANLASTWHGGNMDFGLELGGKNFEQFGDVEGLQDYLEAYVQKEDKALSISDRAYYRAKVSLTDRKITIARQKRDRLDRKLQKEYSAKNINHNFDDSYAYTKYPAGDYKIDELTSVKLDKGE